MKTRLLLTIIAAVEFLTGVALLLVPASVAWLLLGQSLDSNAALMVGRVAGMALIAIGLVCWLDRTNDSPAPLLTGLLAYNAIVPVILVHGYATQGINGIGLWPAVLLHLVLAGWIAACLLGRSKA